MIDSFSRHASAFTSRLLLVLAVLVCLALGLVGLVLPVIPGLLFLLLAALAAARLSPRLGNRLRGFGPLRSILRQDSPLSRLDFADRCRYGFWMTLKLIIDGGTWLGERAAARLRP